MAVTHREAWKIIYLFPSGKNLRNLCPLKDPAPRYFDYLNSKPLVELTLNPYGAYTPLRMSKVNSSHFNLIIV